LHEIGIASSILSCVEAEARRRTEVAICAVGVRIGELSAIDKDALAFAFEALTRNTPLEKVRIEIEWLPRRQKCLSCSEEFAVKDLDLNCPKCGDSRTTCTGGTELDIAYLEVEELCVKS
jgi:hydrogenase nickel incorporation protein HypA/HybF